MLVVLTKKVKKKLVVYVTQWKGNTQEKIQLIITLFNKLFTIKKRTTVEFCKKTLSFKLTNIKSS